VTLDGYRPGASAQLLALHMAYYGPTWGFGRPFESKLAAEMGAFVARLDPARDLFLTAWTEAGTLAGSITIDGHDTARAHLRWFIVATPGRGLGERLLERACAFVDERGFACTHLTTFAGLDAAARLYARHGFVLVEERAVDPWAGTVGEQRWERRRDARGAASP
jgi:GNAT superfamily N-acetyltransferase